LRIAYSPRLGNFPVDSQVDGVVAEAVETMRRHGVEVDEIELDFKADHKELAALWVRTIAIHYAAIAVHWKKDGIDLMGEHAGELTPQFLAMLKDAYKVSAVDHALDDVLRTGVLDGLEDVFETHDLIVAPTLAIPPVKNAADGNTIGPTSINGETVDPLIGWCMTYPINYTGHPAISVPAGFTAQGLPVGLQFIGRRHADESVLAMAARFERMQPWFGRYLGLAGR
jgi:amidase/aspartyl-tRNA(Asn)/glutamyl-tRNA(Gln) amidotransferase subunit A